MKLVSSLVVLCAVLGLMVAMTPVTEAGGGQGQGADIAFMSYSPGGGLTDAGFDFTAQITCNITCSSGKTTSTEVDDEQGCVEDCNEFCNTTTCRIL